MEPVRPSACNSSVARRSRWATMCRSHDFGRDGPQEVGIGPGVTCGLTHRPAPPVSAKLGCLETRRNSLDPFCYVLDAVRSGISCCSLSAGSLGAGSFSLKGLIGLRQLVGDGEGGKQQQPRLSDLTDFPDKLGHLPVDILRETADSGLLPVIAEDRERAAVHRHRDLAYQRSPFKARSILATASSTRATICAASSRSR
jgi:hypothetical protein